MKAAFFDRFAAPIQIKEVPDPVPSPDGVVIRVKATGLCRSDWHGWMGHDADIQLPHVPGHELAGEIVETGRQVRHWKKGMRVTLPFACGCGSCRTCQQGQQQICDDYFQPGFTAWGSMAPYVAVRYADTNLIRLPESMDFTTAAILGCRFITAFRAVVHQGKLQGGQWLAVYGCGGVGLSAIMIASAVGAQVIAVDIDADKLAFAKKMGAHHTLVATNSAEVPYQLKSLTSGGVHLSLDALGSRETCYQSVLSLRKQGKHIQVGLLLGDQADPPVPMSTVIANELEIIGSHGMQAHQYPTMMDMIQTGQLAPEKLIGRKVSLAEGVEELQQMHLFPGSGITVIDRFQ